MLKDNETERIDSEYFKKEYLKTIRKIHNVRGEYLNELATVTGGKRLPLGENFSEEGVKYIRAEDIKNSFVDLSNAPCISMDLHEKLKRYITKYNDILLTNVGNIGDVAFYKNKRISNITENCVKICSYKGNIQEILFAFFLSNYGQIQIQRETVGTVQPKLALERIRKIFIPRFSEEFIKNIKNTIDKANESIELSQKLYREANEVLLSKINTGDIVKDTRNYTIKKFNTVNDENFRIDAEYYHEKYDKLKNLLSKYKYKKIKDIVKIKKSIEPGSNLYRENGIPFIRVSNLFSNKITNPDVFLDTNEIAGLNQLFLKKDTILLSKDGSIGIAYKIKKDMEAVTSGAILHLIIKDQKEILPDYLTLVLNSDIVKLQAERDSNGAIIKHWKPSEIENVIIPILDISIQEEISRKVINSFKLSEKSENLLEISKKAIEISIEAGEQKAIEYINSKDAK